VHSNGTINVPDAVDDEIAAVFSLMLKQPWPVL
jgi:hypothetical protein